MVSHLHGIPTPSSGLKGKPQRNATPHVALAPPNRSVHSTGIDYLDHTVKTVHMITRGATIRHRHQLVLVSI